MDPATLADLALELGVTSRDVREVLDARYGPIAGQGSAATLGRLTAEQVQHVLTALAGHGRGASVWSLEPGETVRRRDLQDTYDRAGFKSADIAGVIGVSLGRVSRLLSEVRHV